MLEGESAHFLYFLVWQEITLGFVNTGLVGNGLGCSCVISAEHDDLADACGVDAFNGFASLGSNSVAHG